MSMSIAIALGALFAALAPSFAMYVQFRKTDADSYEDRLERRIEQLEEKVAHLESENSRLAAENLRLMRLLLAKEQ